MFALHLLFIMCFFLAFFKIKSIRNINCLLYKNTGRQKEILYVNLYYYVQ